MTVDDKKRELGSMIWRVATQLVHGGKMSGARFMDYMLGALFYRFISENLCDYCNSLIGEGGERFEAMTDEAAAVGKDQLLMEKGFFILPSQLFINVASRAKSDPDLNATLANNFKAIEESAKGTRSEDDLKGLFGSFDTNSNDLGATVAERNAVLTNLLETVRDIPFGDYRGVGFDVFGYCYEYLLKMYALGSGTKGGEFYTPTEVSYLLARLAVGERTKLQNVYDPACGSGSLMLSVMRLIDPENITEGFFGQEIIHRTYSLCRMNMFLHNVNYNSFDIRLGDTLISPKIDLNKRFEVIVSNPPYSTSWPGDSDLSLYEDERYRPAAALAPRSKADFAFVMHILHHLHVTGTAAVVEFPGVLYRGGSEKLIRKYMVDNNLIDTIIQLPSNLFFGATIATCILVLQKNKKDDTMVFIDASREFVHEGNMNKLSDENIENIYSARAKREDIAHFCKIVRLRDVRDKDYNLSVSTYVEPEDTREVIDIDQLHEQLDEVVARQEQLRAEIKQIIQEL